MDGRSIPHDRVQLREHPRTIGWLGTSALAMGGSNQMVFLIGALIAAQGSAAIPILIVGVLLGWAAAPGLDRARAHVAQARRRHRRDVRRGVPAVQPDPREPDRRLLLVGLGPDLRPHRDPLGHRAARVVPAVHPGHAAGHRASCSRSPASTCSASRAVTRVAIPIALRRRRLLALPLGRHPRPRRARSTGTRRRPSTSTRRSTACSAPSPSAMAGLYLDRLRRAGLRGRRVPRRRDDRSRAQRPARDASPAARWRRSTSSCCRSCGWASLGPTAIGRRAHADASARPSRRCSAAAPRPRRSGS